MRNSEYNYRIHNICMFIIVISIAIALMFIGCNNESKVDDKESIITNYDYNSHISQSVEYDYIREEFMLTTKCNYKLKTLYLEIDKFTTDEQLDSLKSMRHEEAKKILIKLITYNLKFDNN